MIHDIWYNLLCSLIDITTKNPRYVLPFYGISVLYTYKITKNCDFKKSSVQQVK